jgi:enoyl-CoA hydratase/carnithine racemase
LAHRLEDGAELAADVRPKPVPPLPVRGRGVGQAVAALQASKRLLKRSFREQIRAAMKAENEAFSGQIRSAEAKEALAAFLEKRAPDFTRPSKPVAAT